MLLIAFTVKLHWFESGPGPWTHNLILPAVCLALPAIGRLAIVVRSSMIDELNTQYVKVAKAKGMTQRRILGVHAMRNAGIPYVTLLGWEIIRALAGYTVVVESVFNWPGLGFMAKTAIQNQDFFLIQAIVFVDCCHGRLVEHRDRHRLQGSRPEGGPAMTMPDEYTAQHHDVEEAEQSEEALHGRPFELAAARSKGLLPDLVRDKLGLASLVFLVGLVGSAIFVPMFRHVDPNARQPLQLVGVAGVARRVVEQSPRHRLARLRRPRQAALGGADFADHRRARGDPRRNVRRPRRPAVGLQGRPRRPLVDGLGRCPGVLSRTAAWRCS